MLSVKEEGEAGQRQSKGKLTPLHSFRSLSAALLLHLRFPHHVCPQMGRALLQHLALAARDAGPGCQAVPGFTCFAARTPSMYNSRAKSVRCRATERHMRRAERH